MLIGFRRGQGSIILRVKILNSSVSTGAGLTGLVNTSSGLIISTIADTESTATAYTAAATNIETITTNGTFSAPTAGKCRFKEVDATNHKGVYEIQIADARFNVSSAKSLLVSVAGATNAAETDVVIPLRDLDPYDGTSGGLSRIDAAISSRMAAYTQPTGFLAASFPTTVASPTNITAGTITTVSGNVGGNVVGSVGSVTAGVTVSANNDKTGYSLATAPPTAGAIADAVWDEAYNQHTTAGTFGKVLDTLRKANYVTEGSVAAGGTPTTTSFRTDLTEPDGTFDNQTLLFITGVLAGESVPILTFANTNGLMTTQDALTAVPTAGDEFVILPDHVHGTGEIADAVLDDAVEGSETLRQAVRLMRAALVGKLSGAATTTVTIRDASDTKARITATVDADGNRSAVTTDAT